MLVILGFCPCDFHCENKQSEPIVPNQLLAIEALTWQDAVSDMPQQCGLRKVRTCSPYRSIRPVWQREAGGSTTHSLNVRSIPWGHFLSTQNCDLTGNLSTFTFPGTPQPCGTLW